MANDFMILEDIGTQHDTMLEKVIAKSSDRSFNSLNEAMDYTAWCIRKGLKNLGIDANEKTPDFVIDACLKEKKVEVQRYKSNEHAGVFIYCDSELQYFISDAFEKDDIIFHKKIYYVRTNVC
jgi:hypothetical protein